jgi:hypothetical protein
MTMDDGRFDAWTRRRFGLGFGGLAAGLLGAATGQGAVAKKKKKPKGCTRKQKQKCRRQDRVCEKGKCVIACNARNSACRGNNIIQLCGGGQAFCDCSPLAEGGFACAATRPETCPAASECARDAECASGEVCVDVSAAECCGGEEFGICRKRCKAGNPGL